MKQFSPGMGRGVVWAGVGVAVVIIAALVPRAETLGGGAAPQFSHSSEESQQDVESEQTAPPEANSSAEPEEPSEEGTRNTEQSPSSDAEGDQSETDTGPISALTQLSDIPIKGRAPQTGYDREGQFGESWLDWDQNGCDTRNDILRRDLDDRVEDSRCRILSGVLRDPFSGEEIFFERGETTSILVQVDHVVSLSNAWQTGAQQLTMNQRISLANNPLNLIAVSGRLNAQKGDGDAATWLPPNRGFWCEYVARQVAVKSEYGLWMTQAEYTRIQDILSACPDFPSLSSEQHSAARPGQIPPSG